MMNGGGGRRKIFGPPPNGRKDRPDEDLLLFREMHKREKDRVVSLLQPVSDEFEANGNYPLYKMASAKKGSSGYEFLAESSKNDYDWLKTPPATPLFPSLEMEANAPELVVQRELPIFQPLSRFSGYSATSKSSSGSNKSPSPSPKPKVPPRTATPSEKALETKAATRSKPVLSNQKTTQLSSNDHVCRRSNAASTAAKPTTHQKEGPHEHFLGSNLSKSMGPIDSKTKPKSRGVSPLVRTTIPGFSDDKPPNLRTDRSSSAARGRSGNKTLANVSQKTESNSKTKRQSCSPSVTRGRKVETKQESTTETNVIPHKGKIQTGNGTQILGSRMVDKFMNARKSSAEERETKPKLRSPIHDSSGFGRLMSKSSLDMALKHMDIKREPVNFHRVGPTTRRS